MRWHEITESVGFELKLVDSSRSPASVLDYDGEVFDDYHIMIDGERAGEITVQVGSTTVAIRNAILYSETHHRKGIGKSVYTAIAGLYPGKKVRSSYSYNRLNGGEYVGMSDKALALWDSLVRRGKAEKIATNDRRFYYQFR